jgi:nicotinate-nucleotide adenylyltransferase
MSVRSVAGVLGGTFDPVHFGHLEIAEWLRAGLRLARLMLLPSAVPPHKSRSDMAPARHREAMLRLAVRERPDLEINTLELDSGGVCYTIETLRHLRQSDPGGEPAFILGMDALLELPTWREYRALVREFDLIAVDRAGETLEKALPRLDPVVVERLRRPAELEDVAAALHGSESRGRIFPIRRDPIPISSSKIRERAAARLGLDGLVPPSVARYIQRNGLYRQED